MNLYRKTIINFKYKNVLEWTYQKTKNLALHVCLYHCKMHTSFSSIRVQHSILFLREYLLKRALPAVVRNCHDFSFQQSVMKTVAKTLFNKIKAYSNIHCSWFITITSGMDEPSLDMLFYAWWFRMPFYSILQYFRKEKAQILHMAINHGACSYGSSYKVTQPLGL